jgi:signal transduction histidine kinase
LQLGLAMAKRIGLDFMVKIISARTAGYSLAWIVAVLLIPILYMGAHIGFTLNTEHDAIVREIIGADYMNQIGPIILDSANHEIGPSSKSTMENGGAALSSKLGIAAENNSLFLSLSYPNPDFHAVLSQAVGLSLKTGIVSGITYDGDPESYHVGNINSEVLPEAILAFFHLKDVVLNAAAQENDQNSNLITLAIGNLSAATARLHSSLLLAKQASGQIEDVNGLLHRSELMQKDMNRLSEFGLGMSMGSQKQIKSELIDQINFMNPRWVADFRFESEKLRERFSDLMQERQTAIQNRILRVFLTSFATVFLGLGSAIAMYKSTLKQLDEVETAKSSAEQTRTQAEHMSAELSTINNEMVRVNNELANNMQMLKDAQDALVRKGRMEQMGQLTATIAHELRNPLGAVRTSAFLIERKIKGRELGIEPQIMRINNGVTRCDDIITQLLDFSRSKKLACRSENLDKWLERVVSEEAAQLPASVEINCMLGLNDMQVPFDPSRLQRAIINLLSNASEALVGKGDDPGRFANTTPKITVTTLAMPEFAMIAVSDNGPGISPENLLKIREPLFTTKSFGTGLGLPAVEQIVIQHGGSLDIQSILGLGARFTIKLPLNNTVEDAA